MKIPTEPIGSIPRPAYLVDMMQAFFNGEATASDMAIATERATEETIKLLEQTGSPVITDGEQSKPSFVTYVIHGSQHLASHGVVIPFADGHIRQLPKFTGKKFRYENFASTYLKKAKQFTTLPIKQAVISVSAISLLYPPEGIDGYSQQEFTNDLLWEAEKDIRQCLDGGAYHVQIDLTEARLAIKLDPSKALLKAFIELNNKVLDRFTEEEKKRIGIHTCPGGDCDSTHSADIDYAELLPYLFELHAGNFYLEYAAEKNKTYVLQSIRESMRPGQRIFLGVTDVINPKIETPEEICDLILEAAGKLPVSQLGTTDDCGFSPFADDTSTARDIAFAKIKARLAGTKLAEKKLNL